MNSIVVAKFGGTSMANAIAMKKSAQIVCQNPKIKLVVVSATSGTSNQLVEIYNHFSSCNKIKAQELLELVQHKHTLIAKDFGCISESPNEEWKNFQLLFYKLNTIALELAQIVQQKNAHEIAKKLDQFLSLGEEISAHLFIIALRTQNIDAQFFNVQKVLITDDHFGKAEPILCEIAQKTNEFLKPLLNDGKIRVVQGFVGATQLGETTTLGRGGSDYSAALLAEGLQADELQIWTDVPGIMTMDPNVVSKAKIIPQMSFPVAAELANFGARVLHPATLWPAMRQNIKTFVGSTFTPDWGGTWIYPEHECTLPLDSLNVQPVQAIAIRKKQTLITVTSLRMLNAHGFLAKLFGILAAYELSVDLVTTSEVSVALTIDQNSLGSSGEGISKYSQMFDVLKEFCEVTIEEGLTLVAIIGTNLLKTPNLEARTFNSTTQFNVRLVCHGASLHNLCFLVKSEEAIEVAKILHEEFIEKISTLPLELRPRPSQPSSEFFERTNELST